jgi:hypothetical protein
MDFLQFLDIFLPILVGVSFGFIYRIQHIHIETLRKQNKLLDRQNVLLVDLIESLREDPNAF